MLVIILVNLFIISFYTGAAVAVALVTRGSALGATLPCALGALAGVTPVLLSRGVRLARVAGRAAHRADDASSGDAAGDRSSSTTTVASVASRTTLLVIAGRETRIELPAFPAQFVRRTATQHVWSLSRSGDK